MSESTDTLTIERVRWAFETWAEGTQHTHGNFSVDGTQYVGRVPAAEHREAEAVVLAAVPGLLGEVERLRSVIAGAAFALQDYEGNGALARRVGERLADALAPEPAGTPTGDRSTP